LLDFILQILSVHDTRKVKHFGTVVNLRPKPMFEQLFGFAQILGRTELIQVGKDTHDFGETVCLQNVEKLKGFHFETEFGIHAQEDEIGNLGTVQL
jgi:hypothetical protein